MFKKADKKFLKVHRDKVNQAIRYLKSKSITKINNITKAASV